MSFERPLRGGCSCGRNTYIIEVPPNTSEVAQVFFDRSSSHLRYHASPLSAWLRVPLSWYHSTTYAFFDDETHTAIRKLYTSPHEQHAQRHFCGFCGTPISYWSEHPKTEADYINLTLGSLSGADLRDLDGLGLLPEELAEEIETSKGAASEEQTASTGNTVIGRPGEKMESRVGVVPWFETMLQGSNLGRAKRIRGTGQTGDGRAKIEWEVIELLPDDVDTQTTGKRKLDVVEINDTVTDEHH